MTDSRGGSPERRYWDSCVFIHLIQGNEPSGGNDLKTLIAQAKEGKIEIVTSTITMAEVVKPYRCDGKSMAEADKQLAVSAFIDHPIILVDVIQPIAARAREIQWGIEGIKPYDAIHLATAEFAKVVRFDTTDQATIIDKVKAATGFSWNHAFQVEFPKCLQTELDLKNE